VVKCEIGFHVLTHKGYEYWTLKVQKKWLLYFLLVNSNALRIKNANISFIGDYNLNMKLFYWGILFITCEKLYLLSQLLNVTLLFPYKCL